MNRRQALGTLMALTVGSSRAASNADSLVQIAPLERFLTVWSFVNFDFQGQPAFLTRVPRPETELGKRRALEFRDDVFLLGLLRACSHNGCPVHWSATPALEREFVCRCHGSIFRAADGDRIAGIAPSPLTALHLELRSGVVCAIGVQSHVTLRNS
jgi:Rieske Fe-S protein